MTVTKMKKKKGTTRWKKAITRKSETMDCTLFQGKRTRSKHKIERVTIIKEKKGMKRQERMKVKQPNDQRGEAKQVQ